MAASLNSSAQSFVEFLRTAGERANEDMALVWFREVFGERFTRQGDAARADGYLPGSFVLELKSKSSDWLAGLCQGLAYQNLELDFAHVVVAAEKVLLVWRVDDLPNDLRAAALAASGAPNAIGRELARQFGSRRIALRNCAVWDAKALFEPLFAGQDPLIAEELDRFAQLLIDGRKRRLAIRPPNLRTALKDLKPFFEPTEPLAAVRAFYTMLYGWTSNATVTLSRRADDAVTIGGETVNRLVPGKRIAFKDYVEARYIDTGVPGAVDEFFAAYDVAVDAVDPEYRRKHGMYFTDLNLSRFVMWLARDHVPNLGQDYLVIDPACGSGNLVSNWRSPLDLRHKVVSEIDPELLFAVEKRLKGDVWHQGRFTVVPQVSEGRGLNFLDRTAEQYLEEISRALEARGHSADKPLAFLCNPPYRGDDDQAAGAADYDIDPAIIAMTGADAQRERYCCFLAQMKMVCRAAADSGMPGEPLLLLFTKSAWLTRRSIFSSIRREILSEFEAVDGALFNGAEFFDVKGRWPVAFTIWRYRGPNAGLDADRAIPIRDLTKLTRRELQAVPWDDAVAAEATCRELMERAPGEVSLGKTRQSLRDWTGQTMTDFKRDRRKAEIGLVDGVGGLPAGDARRSNKKTYGSPDGGHVGFMDDLTPCRVARGRADRPWFRLNSQFMDAKKNRCFSGPPSHLGFCAFDLQAAGPLFFWYALARSFLQTPYPMWADAEDLWAPRIDAEKRDAVYASAMALAYAENECVETVFPAHNPVHGAKELHVANPMTPLVAFSFWSTTLAPYVRRCAPTVSQELTATVDALFENWRSRFAKHAEIHIDYEARYHVKQRPLTIAAGLSQIRDFAIHTEDAVLLERLDAVRQSLRSARDAFTQLVRSSDGLAYFHTASADVRTEIVPDDIELPGLAENTPFQVVLGRRLAVASRVLDRLDHDRTLGRTKLVKLLYLADQRTTLDLRMSWAREAAGPLDARALYHPKVGLESLARKAGLFKSDEAGGMVRYRPEPRFFTARPWVEQRLGSNASEIDRLAELFEPLDTDQCEIVATLYACWNDLLLAGHAPNDDRVLKEFREGWHVSKSRFPKTRLTRALAWMRANDLVPFGRGSSTRKKISVNSF